MNAIRHNRDEKTNITPTLNISSTDDDLEIIIRMTMNTEMCSGG